MLPARISTVKFDARFNRGVRTRYCDHGEQQL